MTVTHLNKLKTPADLLRRSDNSTLELVNGHLIDKTSSVLSSEVEGMIFSRIRKHIAENDGAKVFLGSLGYCCFPHDINRIRKPDVTVVLAERMQPF